MSAVYYTSDQRAVPVPPALAREGLLQRQWSWMLRRLLTLAGDRRDRGPVTRVQQLARDALALAQVDVTSEALADVIYQLRRAGAFGKCLPNRGG